MASLITRVSGWAERQRERQEHDRLETSPSHDEQDQDPEEAAETAASPSSDETTTLTGQRRQRRRSSRVTTDSAGGSSRRNSGSTSSEQQRSGRSNEGSAFATTIMSGSADDAEPAADTSIEESEGIPTEESTTNSGRPTLAQLQAERVRMQQRSNLCVMSAVFLLFFLWVQAIGSGDFGLLLVCLIGTNWTARFMRHQRERDEEFERFLANYDETAPTGGDSETTIYGHDIQNLSFQAQVALAIMESQRQMLEGGHGHPDGGAGGRGVSDAAKERWTKFEYVEDESAVDKDALKKPADEDLPHCSICLAEYETGDACVRLPCGHEYHQDCVDSWTANHTRCPLCMHNLEDGDDSESP